MLHDEMVVMQASQDEILARSVRGHNATLPALQLPTNGSALTAECLVRGYMTLH